VNRLPFSVYDFFGYLCSGFLFWGSLDLIWGCQMLIADELKLGMALFWLVIVYTTGHILANLSAFALERTLVHVILTPPSKSLFREDNSWRRKLFPGFYTRLPDITRGRITAKARAAGINTDGEPLFIHAFGKVKRDPITMNRLDGFINAYGFCRNMCFTLFLLTLILLLKTFFSSIDYAKWVLIAIVASIAMFYRYLKFYRQYSYELFVTYSECEEEEKCP